MKKFNIIALIYLFFIILSSCSTVKKGFENPKKNSSDEFLVEKKSPLVMPPEFNELPIPKNQDGIIQVEKNSIKNMISEKNKDENTSVTNKDLEGSILDKIKTD
tara:strand:+ start:106 stop:417 length:312 start_codon:yes stop_codon:yes gene_type:complete